MVKKYTIICQSEDEMNRRADELIEKGFKVERVTKGAPFFPFILITYNVRYWK